LTAGKPGAPDGVHDGLSIHVIARRQVMAKSTASGRGTAPGTTVRAVRNIPAKVPAAEPEIQEGAGRSAARDERTKRQLKRHPANEPKIDSVEADDIP
jgi:hypothetical protein